MRRPPTAAAALATLAVLTAGCAGAEVGARQVPAYITGHVLAGPPCPPRAQTACVGRPVPGAVVIANGKDGAHRVPADATGGYSIALLTGEWTLAATSPDGTRHSSEVRIFLQPAQNLTVDLRMP